MLPQRMSVKFFFEPGAAPAPSTFVALFHNWIQEESVPGLLLDVVDYSHVHHGPGVLLVGHEGDYALDMSNGRPGLLYRRKRAWPAPEDTLVARLRLVVATGLQAVDAMDGAAVSSHRARLRPDELELAFTDSLTMPNNELSWRRVKHALPPALDGLYPGQAIAATPLLCDRRQPLQVRVVLQPVPVARPVAGTVQ